LAGFTESSKQTCRRSNAKRAGEDSKGGRGQKSLAFVVGSHGANSNLRAKTQKENVYKERKNREADGNGQKRTGHVDRRVYHWE